jgi:hypothetical protein
MSKAKRYLDAVTSEKEDTKNTISIDVREKNAAIKKLKDDLKKARGNAMESQGIQARLTLMESLVKEQKKVEETVKQKCKDAQARFVSCKKKVEAMKIERGRPESSLAVDIELTLQKYFISSAAYHGGDLNGVCCRRLVEHAQAITNELEPVIMSKRDANCDINDIKKNAILRAHARLT